MKSYITKQKIGRYSNAKSQVCDLQNIVNLIVSKLYYFLLSQNFLPSCCQISGETVKITPITLSFYRRKKLEVLGLLECHQDSGSQCTVHSTKQGVVKSIGEPINTILGMQKLGFRGAYVVGSCAFLVIADLVQEFFKNSFNKFKVF